MAARPPTRDADTEVLEVAVELHAQEEVDKDAERARRAVHEAAVELGVDHQLVRAEAEVARRRAEAEARRAEADARRARRKTWLKRLGGLALAIGLGIGAWQIAQPAPPTPWTLVADERAWVLDVSPGTVARETEETHEGRTVPVVTVDRAAPRGDGTWFVNLDRSDVPAFAGHDTLVIALSGTLPRARVYLEAGSDARWRSPPIEVRATWTDHRLPLASFERQVKRPDGRWQVVASAPPEGITTVSVKLGHVVNEADARGLVRVGEIHVE
ncbi:MAG: hypothetical protein IT385_00955 [Deltaproteobacteria bacterium]|nr:hypothetical protein [Deltaproteobacteria bacterium]